ncbi:MAG: TldD/PmbA family protein [Gemmatimonadota bacterium]
MANYFDRGRAQEISEKVLALSNADQARVNLNSGETGNTRFAVNQISTAGDVFNATLVVTSAFGNRVASATTNSFDDEALERVVRTSEQLAQLIPEDPEYMGELGPQEYQDVDMVASSTANLTPAERARAITAVTEPAAEQGLLSTGYLSHNTGQSSVATSGGLFAYQDRSLVTFTTTVRTPDGTGSGWAGGGSKDWNDLDLGDIGERAIEKAIRSRSPRAVEPGRWTVILEPTAVSNMISRMMFSLNARFADEGRSFFSKEGGGNKIGEKFLDDRVTIYTDPADARLAPNLFNGQGLPNRRMDWVQNGVLQNLAYSRYWASQQGVDPTGFVSGYYMEGGDASLQDMIASTERGLLLTRLWYIRSVDPRTILFTGLTRDGTFLIENGQISHAVKNLRWNESPVFMLNNLEELGAPVPVSPTESGGTSPTVMVPPIKVRDFNFTSISDAV